MEVKVHRFYLPEDVIRKWKWEGLVQEFRDTDFVTGVVNEELRFAPSLAEELNRYLQ